MQRSQALSLSPRGVLATSPLWLYCVLTECVPPHHGIPRRPDPGGRWCLSFLGLWLGRKCHQVARPPSRGGGASLSACPGALPRSHSGQTQAPVHCFLAASPEGPPRGGPVSSTPATTPWGMVQVHGLCLLAWWPSPPAPQFPPL